MSQNIEDRGYVHPEKLVSTEWVAEHLDDPQVRIVESNEDPLLYPSSHIPGAVQIDWTVDLNDQLRRDYLDQSGFESLMSRNGITRDMTVVFYGDRSNWWACYALWVFLLYGHDNARVMDGGRTKWELEGRELVREVPVYAHTDYRAPVRDDETERAFREDVLAHVEAGRRMVDVRSPEEFSGELLHMPGSAQEGALRGGHIPGANSVPWSRATNPEDGTFLNAADLRAIYEEEQGLSPDDDVITYCRIGERSSHTWFALKYLMGYDQVRNYDGSWTEWGNLVNVPIER
ncbi:MAG: sulfurtransferase [Anaerolineaceae bacterium]|nr:sulfurtransferase [Anaerolineaceae bacterium]MCY4023449.1 sulfurtransferase [Anaerolineaceae bacterium]